MTLRFSTFGHIFQIDKEYVNKVMKPSSSYNRPYYYVEKFEKEFAKYCGRKYCLLTLIAHLQYTYTYILWLKESDEIIVPGQLGCKCFSSISN